MASETPIFVFMDTLPTISECVSCITSYAVSYGTKKQKDTVGIFAKQIEELWHKAFSKEHVVLRYAIKQRLDTHLKSYHNEVRKNSRVSKRKAYREWQGKNNKLFDLLKPTSNPENFDEDEKKFYFDQKTVSRKMALSDQVDEDYEALLLGQMKEDSESLDDDNDICVDGSIVNSHENDTLLLTQSKMRSGRVRWTKCLTDVSTQTDQDQPQAVTPIRKKRNVIPDVKTAIASTSAKAGITSEQARRAFQTVCEVFTKDKYYLSVEEVPNAEANAHTNQTPKRPRSSGDYEKYKYVLPSARTIDREKYY